MSASPRTTSSERAAHGTRSDAPREQSSQWVVQPGDCLAAIAERCGLLPETIWRYDGNAELRAKRASSRVLEPGDVLVIPARRVARVEKASGRKHRFVRKGRRARLELQLRREGEPRADVEYTLVVDGRQPVEGRTDAEGRIDQPIPPGARRGVLTLPEDGERIVLRLGHLDPETSARGAQSRLRHLGFYGGAVDGEVGERTTESLLAFQRAHQLEESGRLDEGTGEKLREMHGS